MARDEWERAYTSGHHAHDPGAPWSSPELAGFLAGLDVLPRTALDLGCGTGGDAVYLAEQGIDTIGIDISPTALRHAASRAETNGVAVTWIEGDVRSLPLDDASIDLVTDRGCLHHVAGEDRRRYASEVARVLRPGGRLLIRELNHAGHDEHAVTEDDIRAMLADLPLTIQSVVGFDRGGRHGSARTTMTVLRRA